MKRFVLLMTVALGLSSSGCDRKAVVRVEAPAGQWVALFNGRNLEGWTVKIAGEPLDENYRNTFHVEDGLLKVSYEHYDKFAGRFGSLFAKRKLSHYWLRAEYRFVGELAQGAPSWAYQNSGIQLHSQPPETMRTAQEFPVSVEFDLVGSRSFGRAPTGDVCENGTRVTIANRVLEQKCSRLSNVRIPGGKWVTVLAEVNGAARVRHIVDGALVLEYTNLQLDATNPDARALMKRGADKALDEGYVSIQSNGHPIDFRRIEVLPIE